jgi:hypothetical protein
MFVRSYPQLHLEADNPMIDFIHGTIKVDNRFISIATDHKTLNDVAKDGLIEKRRSGRGIYYYYFETSVDEKRFGVFITLGAKTIDWIRLSWLDSPMKAWADVSEKAVKEEFRMLIRLAEKMVESNPDDKKHTLHTWRLKWGKLQVSCDLRSFQADIYMKPELTNL